MVVVHFVSGGVWHGVAVIVVVAMFSGGWGLNRGCGDGFSKMGWDERGMGVLTVAS